MRFISAVILALAVLVACENKPKPKPTLTITSVQICTDTAFLLRYEDRLCEQEEEGYAWRYVTDRADQSAELPAIEQRLTQRGHSGSPQPGVTYGRVPPEGAFFKRG